MRVDSLNALLGVRLALIQAPMAGVSGLVLAVAVAGAGGRGWRPCALLSTEQIRAQVSAFRTQVKAPLNLNFLVHRIPMADPAREAAWSQSLRPYFEQYGLAESEAMGPSRTPFDSEMCDLIEELRPEIVSFPFRPSRIYAHDARADDRRENTFVRHDARRGALS
jgi:nitronate monooxygenase